MTEFRKSLPRFLKDNVLVFVFVFDLLAKLVLFNAVNGLWPAKDQIVSFLIYSFATAAILTIPALFFRKRKLGYLLLADIFLLIVLVMDTLYLRFFDTLPVVSLLSTSSQLAGDIGGWASKLFSLNDIYLILDFVVVVFLLSGKNYRHLLRPKYGIIHRKMASLLALIPVIILVGAISYDFNGKLPYLYNQISENKVVSKNIGIIGAHLMDISRNLAQAIDTVTPDDKQAAFAAIKTNTNKIKTNKYTGIAKSKRIFMIQVESLDNFVINEKVNGQEVTPNLNKLAASSNYFANDYFTVGAGGTSDADYSVNTSTYPLENASVFVKYGKDAFTSLEKELKSVGYTTNAYHANSAGYWNRATAFKSLGFDNFFAENTYKKGEMVNMGLADKDFLDQAFVKIQSQPVQSLNYLITLSSHFSFETPNKDKGLNLPKGKYPALTTDYLQAIHYTDGALGDFIQMLKDNGMYDDSVIVLYGDHTAKYDAFTDDSGKRIDLNSTEGKRIPLFVKLPNQSVGAKFSYPTSHLDIMPTILNLVGAHATSPMFGQDLFDKTARFFFTQAFENDYEQMISGKFKFINNGSSLICTEYANKKNNGVDISNCNGLLDKRNQIQSAVDILIGHNLFGEYLKSS